MKTLNKSLIFILALSFWSTSCSDLEPEFTDVITEDNYFQNDAAFVSALGSAYTNLYSVMNHGQLFSLDATSSDEACITHKGPDWEDGGQWLRMHRHDFSDGEGVFGNVWGFAYGGINTCNRLIATFESVDNPNSPAFIAELKVLRAYYYLVLLDVFGNVPIIETFDVPEGFKPTTSPRADVFAFVEKELTEQVPLLSKSVDQSTYARVNFNVGQAMLASLYLNAEQYTGTPRWADAVAAADEVINGGGYSLEDNYFANFAVDNAGSSENMWVIPYDGVNAGGFNLVQMTLHYDSQKTFNTVDQPWNGYCALADFYNAFEDDDVRITGGGRAYGVLLEGPQKDLAGNQIFDQADSWYPDNAVDDPSLTAEEQQRALVYSVEINELAPGAFRDGGTRLSKYEYEVGTVNSMSNDFALFRYAEVLLNKAEAMWRMNPGSAEALELVNMIRARSGVDAYSSLDADNLLAERGREMCFEAKRRSDLIRFNRWGDSWWEKGTSEDFKKLMPVPADQIALNSNLIQNPGY